MGSTSRSNTKMTNLQKATLNVSEARAALLALDEEASAEDITPLEKRLKDARPNTGAPFCWQKSPRLQPLKIDARLVIAPKCGPT